MADRDVQWRQIGMYSGGGGGGGGGTDASYASYIYKQQGYK